MLRSAIGAACACLLTAPPATADVAFEVDALLGGWGYVEGPSGYDVGGLLAASVGLRPLPWLSVHARLGMHPLAIDDTSVASPRDSPLEKAEGVLLLYGVGVAGRALELGRLEVFAGAQLGLFDQSITGFTDDRSASDFGGPVFEVEVDRSVNGLAWGAVLDGWWRLGEVASVGLRAQYLRMHPWWSCASFDGLETCGDTPADEPAAAVVAVSGGFRFSL